MSICEGRYHSTVCRLYPGRYILLTPERLMGMVRAPAVADVLAPLAGRPEGLVR